MKFSVIPVTPFQQNCSMIWCEESTLAAIVDPGGDMDRIEQLMAQEGVKMSHLSPATARCLHSATNEK